MRTTYALILALIFSLPGISQTTIEIVDGEDSIVVVLNDPLSDAIEVGSYHCFQADFPDGSFAYDYDLDEDGTVGSSDLLIFLGYYGETFTSEDVSILLSQYGSSPELDAPELDFFEVFGIFSSGTLVYVPGELEPDLFDSREVSLPYLDDDGILQYTSYDETGPYFFECPDPYELCMNTFTLILLVEYETGIEAEFYYFVKSVAP